MVIIRDNTGKVIGKEASASYVSTRMLRNRDLRRLEEQATHRPQGETAKLERMNMQRIERGLEPIFNDTGERCNHEDAPCCGCQ